MIAEAKATSDRIKRMLSNNGINSGKKCNKFTYRNSQSKCLDTQEVLPENFSSRQDNPDLFDLNLGSNVQPSNRGISAATPTHRIDYEVPATTKAKLQFPNLVVNSGQNANEECELVSNAQYINNPTKVRPEDNSHREISNSMSTAGTPIAGNKEMSNLGRGKSGIRISASDGKNGNETAAKYFDISKYHGFPNVETGQKRKTKFQDAKGNQSKNPRFTGSFTDLDNTQNPINTLNALLGDMGEALNKYFNIEH